jgi:hypothetical protein
MPRVDSSFRNFAAPAHRLTTSGSSGQVTSTKAMPMATMAELIGEQECNRCTSQ